MKFLLGKIKNLNNFNINNIIDCYEKYFTIDIKKDETFIYLNTKILKEYLEKGINIKYRNYIFLFLQNTLIDNKTYGYKVLDQIDYIIVNKNNKNINNHLMNLIDYNNLENIINISNRINMNKNKFNIKDKNIIKLENNFYVNINLCRFYSYKVKYNIYRFNGIIINYNDYIKSRLLSLFSIDYHHKYNKNDKNNLLDVIKNDICNNDKYIYNTKCNLILTEKNNIKLWKMLFIKYLPEYSLYSINTQKDFKKILNKNILKLDFLIFNIQILNNKFYKKYFDNILCKTQTISFNDIILNSINDNKFNKNIDNESFYNLYLFNWNNIIYDDIEIIKNFDKNNFLFYLNLSKTKYYLGKNYLSDSVLLYIIKNNIKFEDNSYLSNDEINYNLDNFNYFVKKHLLIKNNDKNNNINYLFIELELSNYEKNIYNNLFDDNDDTKKLSEFFLNIYKYNSNFKEIENIKDTLYKYYENLIINEKEKLQIKSYKNIITNSLLNNDININSLYEKEYNNLLTNNIDNNIILYNSKLDYIKKELLNFNEKEHFCSICIEKKKSHDFCILLCGHHFCKLCMKEYLNNKHDPYECPVCRCKFKKNNIFYITIKNNNYDNNILKNNLGTKINKLIEIIEREYEKKIVIVSQFKKMLDNINDILENNNILKNNNMKIYNINNFVKVEKDSPNKIDKIILLISYDDILKINNLNVTSILFLDYLDDNNYFNNSKNPINIFKNKLLYDNLVNFHFLYVKNTFEENIVNKIKSSIDIL
jgi:hypothetical protein